MSDCFGIRIASIGNKAEVLQDKYDGLNVQALVRTLLSLVSDPDYQIFSIPLSETKTSSASK